MKVLVIDRDRDNCEQMQSILQNSGATVTCEPIKNTAMEMIKKEPYDVIFLDPTPQNEMRPFIMGVRRSTNSFPPVIIMAHQGLTRQEVMAAGGNDLLTKPFDQAQLVKVASGAQRITDLSRLMADESEDFPSKEGIIAKSAFNQLFITCLDRADRHGEQSFLIFITIANLDEIAAKDGAEEAKKVAMNLRKIISRTRRTSDIAGHIRQAEFCILLLRPSRDDEHLLAANRFGEAMKENHDLIATSPTKAIVKVSLLAIPNGEIPVERNITGNG